MPCTMSSSFSVHASSRGAVQVRDAPLQERALAISTVLSE